VFSVISAIQSLWPFNCQLQNMTQTSSTNQELNRYQAILEARIAEFERGVRQRDGIAVEQSPDQLDEVQRASERDLAISNIDRESKQLRNARAALRRIREGTFGVCEQCEEDIHPKRLAAIPWASFCIVCQEAQDRNREEMHSPADSGMRYAA
jgi:DnaK suppressor protein